jgi:hypothetical protein
MEGAISSENWDRLSINSQAWIGNIGRVTDYSPDRSQPCLSLMFSGVFQRIMKHGFANTLKM